VILVLGWAMMARRSELVALDLPDVVEEHQGLLVTVRRSKTDHHSRGRHVALPYGADPATCPVRLVRAWTTILIERGITTGPLLRRIDRHGIIGGQPGARISGRGPADGRMAGQAVGMVLARAAGKADIDVDGLRAHSLRAGGVTGAYLAGADLLSIGRHGGWGDGSTVLLRYVRDVDRWKRNPMASAGL
jgi:integrase